MFTRILRSVCVGIASVAVAAYASIFVSIAFAVVDAWRKPHQSSEPEVGWDVVTMWHSNPAVTKLVLVVATVVFAIGFLFGLRYFSKSTSRP